MQNKGDISVWVFFSIRFSFRFPIQCCRLDLLFKRISGEKISVRISASEQANRELQAELKSRWRIGSCLAQSSKPGRKVIRQQFSRLLQRASLIFSKPPVCHVPSSLEARLGGRNAAEHLSAGVWLHQGWSVGWYHGPEPSKGHENTPSVNLSNTLILQMSVATSAKGLWDLCHGERGLSKSHLEQRCHGRGWAGKSLLNSAYVSYHDYYTNFL